MGGTQPARMSPAQSAVEGSGERGEKASLSVEGCRGQVGSGSQIGVEEETPYVDVASRSFTVGGRNGLSWRVGWKKCRYLDDLRT